MTSAYWVIFPILHEILWADQVEKNILETKRNMYKLHYRDSCMRIVVFSYVIVVFSYGNVYAKM